MCALGAVREIARKLGPSAYRFGNRAERITQRKSELDEHRTFDGGFRGPGSL